MSNIDERVKKIIAEQLSVEIEKITPEARFVD
ncbi:MAG: acyl carrier protein, partial [Oceanococcus sp.]